MNDNQINMGMQSPVDTARLIITTEGRDLQVVELGERLTIGRSTSSGLVLDEKTASRNHAEIRRVGRRRYQLADVGSANGTWLNGSRITVPKDLNDGDQIQVGAVRMKFVAPSDPQVSHSKTAASGTVLDIRNEVVVVLISDVRNYTTMSEAFPTREFSEIITQWFRETTEIVKVNMGTVDKFIGDAVMAYWVAKVKADPEPEVNAALNAARTFVSGAQAFSDRHSSRFPGFCFEVGVGLTLGPAMLCNVGNSEHQSFTAVGDTVNVAFRLEPFSKTKGYPIIVSGELAAIASNRYRFHELGQTEVKGRRQPVSIFGIELDDNTKG
jgi:adenylate cyclase